MHARSSKAGIQSYMVANGPPTQASGFRSDRTNCHLDRVADLLVKQTDAAELNIDIGRDQKSACVHRNSTTSTVTFLNIAFATLNVPTTAVPATADEGTQPMATLFALIYPDTETAEAAAETAKGLDQAGFLKILDSAVVTKDANGKVEHKGQRNPVRSVGVAGGVVGAITGLMFAVPVLGLAAGAAVGAYFGSMLKSGGQGDFNAFKEQVDSDLAPGGSALLILGDASSGQERVIQDLGRHGGTLRSTDISDDQVAQTPEGNRQSLRIVPEHVAAGPTEFIRSDQCSHVSPVRSMAVTSSSPVPLTAPDIDQAAEVLARAFADDPALLAVLPDRAQRTKLAPTLARTMVRYAIQCGSPIILPNPLRGLAIWFAPDDPAPTSSELSETGILSVPELIGPEPWTRFERMLGQLDALHHLHAPEPHWYLAMIGVDPAHQHRGHGVALMAPVLRQADLDGVSCYLETPNASNVLFYQRRGFNVVDETDILHGSVHIWMMRRDPVAAATG